MEQTQLLDWDDAGLDSDSPDNTEESQEPVGKLHLCSGTHGPERDFWIHLGDNVIGRHSNCHITLPAQSVSKKHAVIEAEAESHTIYDCGSLNKTRRRKAVLKPNVRYALEDGDLLLFADVACQYFILPPPGGTGAATTQLKDTGDSARAPASPEAAALSTPEDFDSDDESVLVPATQAGAAKSLVFEKTPAAGRMGYGGVLAKDSDEEDGGENSVNPTRKSTGSEESVSSREARDRSTSAAFHSPNSSTVIPESDDEAADASTASARFPSLNLQYESDTEADDSLANPDSAVKARRDGTPPPKTAGPSSENTAKTPVGGASVDKDVAKSREDQGSVVAAEKPPQYHLDSDTDVEDDDPEASTMNGHSGSAESGRAGATEHRPAQFHVDSDTDVEEEEGTATRGDDPASRIENGEQEARKAALQGQAAADFNLDSDTDVDEDAAAPDKPLAAAVQPDIDLGSDTDTEEEAPAPECAAAKQDDDTDVEEEVPAPAKQDDDTDVEEPIAAERTSGRSRPDAPQDSDTDVEEESAGNAAAHPMKSGTSNEQDSDTDVEEPSSAGGKAQQNQVEHDDEQDSDTDVEEEVLCASRKSLMRTGSAGKGRVAADPVLGDDDRDVEESAETQKSTGKTESDVEEYDSPSMGLLATQCYVSPSDEEAAVDANSSADSVEEEEATQAFVFKSPSVKPTPFKKPPLPSPAASVPRQPVRASSEREEFSDDESFAVAETQSFCRGPDLSAIELEDEPTQDFLAGGRAGLRGPPTSTQMEIGSGKGPADARVQSRRSSGVEREVREEETCAEEETQLFCTGGGAQVGSVNPSDDPSQDETQPIAACLDPLQRESQPLPSHTGPKGQNVTAEDPSRVSGSALLERKERERPSVEGGASEATQSLSLHLCLSEEPTQTYSVDVSEALPEPSSEAFDTEPVLPSSYLGNAAEANSPSQEVADGGTVNGPTSEPAAAAQPLASSTPGRNAFGQPQLADTTAASPIVPPRPDEDSQPGPSYSEKAMAPEGGSEAEPPGVVKEKKRPALSKRGRKKKAATDEEEETAAKTIVPPAEPTVAREMAELPNIEEEPAAAQGRQSRRTAAAASTPAGHRNEEREAEALQKAADLKGARKGRVGRGLNKKAAVEEPESQTGAEADAGMGPSTNLEAAACTETPIPDLEAAATKDGPTVDEASSTHLPTADLEATVADAPAADVEESSRDLPASDVGAASTDSPKGEAVPTPGEGGSQVAATARKRGGKRGQATVVVPAEPLVAEPALVEQDRRVNRSRRKSIAPSAEADSKEEAEPEPAPNRARGRPKKAVPGGIADQQQGPAAASVEQSAPTRVSRTRKSSTEAGLEEEVGPAAAVSGRSKRGAPVKEELDTAEDQPKTSEESKRGKKRPAAEVPPETSMEEALEPPPEQPPEAKPASSQPRNRQGRAASPSDQPPSTEEQSQASDEATTPVTEPLLTGTQATAPISGQAAVNDLAGAPLVEQPGSSAASQNPRKRGAVGNRQEQVAKGGTPAAPSRRASRKRGTVETGEEEATEDSAPAIADTRTTRKRGTVEAGEEEAAEAKGTTPAARASRKRGTAETGEEGAAEERAPATTDTRGTAEPGEEETAAEDRAPATADTRTTRKRGTTEAGEEETAEGKGTSPAARASRKRGTVVTGEEGAAEGRAPATAADPRATRKRGTAVAGEEQAEAGKPTTAPRASRKRGAAESAEKEAAAEPATPAVTPAASNRGTAEGGDEAPEAMAGASSNWGAEAEATVAAASLPTGKRGTAEDGEEEVTTETTEAPRSSRKKGEMGAEARAPAAAPRVSRKRGTAQAGEETAEEASNDVPTAVVEQKRRRTRAASSEGSATGVGEEHGKEVPESGSAEPTGNAERKKRRTIAATNEGLAATTVENASKEAEGRRRKPAGKEAAEASNAPQTGIVELKRRRASTASNEGAEAAAASNHHQSESIVETTAGGRSRGKVGREDTAKVSDTDQGKSVEQKRMQAAAESLEGAAAAGADVSQGERGLEISVTKAGRPRKKQPASLQASEEGNQAEAPQSRGRGSRQRKASVTEAKNHEEGQAAAPKGAEGSQSLPSQEEPHSRAASRSNSRGRKQVPQADSSQEPLAPGSRGRKPSSASSEDKAEDASTPPEARTPRRTGRAPLLSSSPAGEHGAPKVMFTGVIDETGEQVVQRLGGELADSVYECTHLVTDRIRRTVKFLCAVARGIPIVTLDWLEKCGKSKCFLSPASFMVKDREQELNFNFRLTESLHKARKQRLFEGYEIHVTPGVKPEPEHMKDIIQCSGATFLPKMPREYKDKRVIISCSADLAKCKPALSAALPIASTEFILTGILQQLADLDAFRLEGTAAPAEAKSRGGKRASCGAAATCSTPPPSTAVAKRRR